MKKIFQNIPISFAPYRSSLCLVVFFHILAALFTVISIPMIIPFFHVLFKSGSKVEAYAASSELENMMISRVREMIDETGVDSAILWICGIFIGLFFLKNLFRYLAMYSMTPIRNGVIRDLRQKLFIQFQSLPVSYIKDNPKGNLISTLMTDVQETEWMIRNSLETIIKSPLIIIGSLVFMIYLEPGLTVFVFVLMLFTVVIIGGVSRALKQESRQAQDTIGELHFIADESLSSYSVVRSFGAEDFIADMFGRLNNMYKNMYDKVLRRRDLASPLSEFLGVTIVAVLLWYGSDKVFSGRLSAEGFFAFLFAFFQIIEPAKSFATAFFTIRKGMGSVDRINDLLEININERFFGKERLHSFQKEIGYSDVSFAYNEKLVLTDINLTVAKGSIISIEGASGEGKSTLLQLLIRFYDPTSGSILIDGKNIESIDIQDLRSMFAYVDQRMSLFHSSVTENIAFGSTNPDMERLKKAAKDAFAHDFISAMDKGYDTIIGEKGSKISGGEGQRLALARAFYHQTPILLLDEASSSIDASSKELIKNALQKKNQEDGMTIIIISHQDELKDLADTRYILNDGRLTLKPS